MRDEVVVKCCDKSVGGVFLSTSRIKVNILVISNTLVIHYDNLCEFLNCLEMSSSEIKNRP